jgi:MoxR-like ATPase
VSNNNFNIRGILPDGLLVCLRPVGSKEIQAIRADTNEDITDNIKRWTRKKAHEKGMGLRLVYTKTGGFQWRQVPMSVVETEMAMSRPAAEAPVVHSEHSNMSMESEWTPLRDEQILDLVSRAGEYKPDNLVIDPIMWRYLIRSALRGKNILMVGPSGCGKTLAALSVGRVFRDRPFFKFNMGATQDARGTLIGNTHYNSEAGTFHVLSEFAHAIQIKGAIVLLDELSRSHDDASNILMTVLDENQRYLRIDESPDIPVIPVAEGVTFVATANIGNEYTGTRVMDRALLDRFVQVEMKPLGKDDEFGLLKMKYPDVEELQLEHVADIAVHTREQLYSEDPKVSTIVSTRMSVEMGALLKDGFTLEEAAQVCIYPFYSQHGGADSERTYMQQLVQKYLPSEYEEKESAWSAEEENKVPWENS